MKRHISRKECFNPPFSGVRFACTGANRVSLVAFHWIIVIGSKGGFEFQRETTRDPSTKSDPTALLRLDQTAFLYRTVKAPTHGARVLPKPCGQHTGFHSFRYLRIPHRVLLTHLPPAFYLKKTLREISTGDHGDSKH